MFHHLLTFTTLLNLAISAPAPATESHPDFKPPVPLNKPITLSHLPTTPIGQTSKQKRNIGGVRLSDGANFTGHVWYGIYPLNDCIGLGDYTHNLLSFRPDEGTECLLMQGECDSARNYVTMNYNSSSMGDLSLYEWIGGVESYFCMTEIFAKKVVVVA